MNRTKQRIILSIVAVFLIASIIFGAVAIPKPANAVGGFAAAAAVIAQTIKDVSRWVADGIAAIYEAIKDAIKAELINQSIDIFAQRVAISTATSIAEGGRGQDSLFEGRTFQNILKDAGGAAAGDFIGNLSENWEKFGIDLCNPSLDLKVSITMSLMKNAGSTDLALPKPKCDLANVVRNWDQFIEEYDLNNLSSKEDINKSLNSIISNFQVQLRPGKSDFAAQVKLNNKLIESMNEKEFAAAVKNSQSPFNDKTNILNTVVQTPARMVEALAGSTITEIQNSRLLKGINSIMSQDTILGRALSTFTNTLTSKLLNKWLSEGMYKLSKLKDNSGIQIPDFVKDQIGGGLAAGSTTSTTGYFGGGVGDGFDRDIFDQPITASSIESYYSDFVVAGFGEVEEYDPLADFIICPDKEDIITVNNCVMSSKLYSAFSRTDTITIKEAIELGLLDSNLPLISDKDPRNADLHYCHKQAFCYSNLQKMRLARLIPLGWEIAASRSDITNPVTLGEVINCFGKESDQCSANYTLGGKTYDFTKLIDPGWVLKAPQARCRARGFGPQLQSGNDKSRYELCVDTQTCLQEDENGNCLPEAWGYCTREKNVWRFGGEQCNDAFASCRSFENNNSTQYLMKDSLDFCTSDEAGCQWYSTANAGTDQTFDKPIRDICGNASNLYLYTNEATANAYCQSKGFTRGTIVNIPTVNLVTNGSFELNSDNTGLPDNITNSTGQWTVSSSTAEVFDGLKSIKNSKTDGNYYYIEIPLSGLTVGRTYSASVYIKRSGNNAVWLWAGGSNIAMASTTSTSWQRVTTAFSATATTAAIRLNHYGGPGSVIFDALQVEEGGVVSVFQTNPYDGVTNDSRCQYLPNTGWERISDSDLIKQVQCFSNDWDEDQKIYLNSQAATCNEESAGCTELMRLETGMNLNLVNYGSFENNLEAIEQPVFIDPGTGGLTNYSSSEEEAYHGSYSLKVFSTGDGGIELLTKRITVIPGEQYTFGVKAKGKDITTNSGSYKPGIFIRQYSSNGTVVGGNWTATQNTSLGTFDWETLSGTITIPSNVAYVKIGLGMNQRNTGVVYFDSLRMEQGNVLTEDKNGETIYMKKAPDYLNCDDPNNYNPDCADYTQSCSADQVGCQLYVPSNGDPSLAGIINSDDYCTAECSGYQQYLKKQTPIEEMFGDSGIEFASFVASSAQSCSLQSVGCEEFTEITNSENRMYFTNLRLCTDTNDPNARAYYTWEGSDTAGYQLKSWQLLKSNIDNGPCTNIRYDANAGRNICIDSVATIDNCSGDNGDFACRVFIDGDNNEYLRKEAKLAKASDECKKVRRTASTDDISAIMPSDSTMCSLEAVGCSEYKGNSGSNTRRLLVDDFESGTSLDWQGGTVSTESVTVTGHSLYIPNGNWLTKQVNVSPNKSYILSFWAKAVDATGVNTANINITDSNGNAFLFTDTGADSILDITTEWKQYQVGPVHYNYNEGDSPSEQNSLRINMNILQGYYIDNIILKEINSDLYLIKNSWTVADQCIGWDGCQEYKDIANNIHYLYNFSSVCPADKAGCSAFVDTKNSSQPGEQIWEMGNLINNGGFEGGLIDWFSNYLPKPEQANFNIDYSESRSGTKSLKVWDTVAASEANGGAALHVISEFIEIVPNTEYNLSTWIKGKNVSGSSGKHPWIGFHTYDANKQVISLWQGITNVPYGTYDWTQIKTEGYVMPPNAKYIKVLITQEWLSSGDVWFDDISLAEYLHVPADEFVYLVDDYDYYCSANAKGCTLVGQRSTSFDKEGNELVDWFDRYIINDPDKYDTTLCGWNSVGCSAYNSEGQTVYIKDPGDKVCTYLVDYEHNGQILRTGWYKSGTIGTANMETCAGDPYDTYLPPRVGGAWEGYVGLCSVENDGCTEFIDPQGTQGQNVIFNGDFELNNKAGAADNSNGIPDFWGKSSSGTASNFNWSSSRGIYDSAAVEVGYIDPQTTGISFYQNLNIFHDQDYAVSMEVKNPSDAARPDFAVSIYCANRTISSFDNSFDIIINDNNGSIATAKFANSLFSSNKFTTVSGKFKIIDPNPNDQNIVCTLSFGTESTNNYHIVDNVKVQSLQSYYYIKDDSINGDDCNGQVSWENGCISVLDKSVLSLDTGAVIRRYDSLASYQESQRLEGNAVTVKTCNPDDPDQRGGCDSNEIIRVQQDRQCGEWLTCSSWAYYQDLSGKTQKTCYSLGRCLELNQDDPSQCAQWSFRQTEVVSDDCPEDAPGCRNYQTRDLSWSGQDYSGYSIINTYALDTLVTKNFGGADRPDWRLTSTINNGENGITISEDEDTIIKSCRIFPEGDAPFAYVEELGIQFETDLDGNYININKRPPSMPQANFCQPGENCECDYVKAEYDQGELLYLNVDANPIREIRYDIDKDNTFSKEQGDYMSYLKSYGEYRGFWGFCLEQDLSRSIQGTLFGSHPCITWMPLDVISGDFNVFGNADIDLPPSTTNYCTAANGIVEPSISLTAYNDTDGWVVNNSVRHKVKDEECYDDGNEAGVGNCSDTQISSMETGEITFLAYSDNAGECIGFSSTGCLDNYACIPDLGSRIDPQLNDVTEASFDANSKVVFSLQNSMHSYQTAMSFSPLADNSALESFNSLFGIETAEAAAQCYPNTIEGRASCNNIGCPWCQPGPSCGSNYVQCYQSYYGPTAYKKLPAEVVLTQTNALNGGTLPAQTDYIIGSSASGGSTSGKIWMKCYQTDGQQDSGWQEVSPANCRATDSNPYILKFYLIKDYNTESASSACYVDNSCTAGTPGCKKGAPAIGVVGETVQDGTLKRQFAYSYQVEIVTGRDINHLDNDLYNPDFEHPDKAYYDSINPLQPNDKQNMIPVKWSLWHGNKDKVCSDRINNDYDPQLGGDALYDMEDPGCASPIDPDNSEYNVEETVECNDGVDNRYQISVHNLNGNGKIDLFDPGCVDRSDVSETNLNSRLAGGSQCSDGIDNDGDGMRDIMDRDCTSGSDGSEYHNTHDQMNTDDDYSTVEYLDVAPACADGQDNDGDGKTDFPNDPGCAGAGDSSEIDLAAAPACSDGKNNDGNNDDDPSTTNITEIKCDYNGCSLKADGTSCESGTEGCTTWPADPGCSGPGDTSEVNPFAGGGECNDGANNDSGFDGLRDLFDPGCRDNSDSSELNLDTRDSYPLTECSDGLDNDGDGLTDFPNDIACAARGDESEGGVRGPASQDPQCWNQYDDDGDGRCDYGTPGGSNKCLRQNGDASNPLDWSNMPVDLGCVAAGDTSEITENNEGNGCFSGENPCPFNQKTWECIDGHENDADNPDLSGTGDGLIDYPADRGCSSIYDNDESSSVKPIAKVVERTDESDNSKVYSGVRAVEINTTSDNQGIAIDINNNGTFETGRKYYVRVKVKKVSGEPSLLVYNGPTLKVDVSTADKNNLANNEIVSTLSGGWEMIEGWFTYGGGNITVYLGKSAGGEIGTYYFDDLEIIRAIDHENICTHVASVSAPFAAALTSGLGQNYLYKKEQGEWGWYGQMKPKTFNPSNSNTWNHTAYWLQPRMSAVDSAYATAGSMEGFTWDPRTGSALGDYGVDVSILSAAELSTLLQRISSSGTSTAAHIKGKDRVADLYAKADVYLLNDKTIDSYSKDVSLGWDIRGEEGWPPVVKEVVYDNDTQTYAEGREGFITINNINDSDIVYYGNTFPVTTTFYAYANDNQSPLVDVEINWGDGISTSGAALNGFANHKYVCNRFCPFNLLTDNGTPAAALGSGSFSDAADLTDWNPTQECSGKYEINDAADWTDKPALKLTTSSGEQWAGVTKKLPTKAGEVYTLTFDFKFNSAIAANPTTGEATTIDGELSRPQARIEFYCPPESPRCEDKSGWGEAGHPGYTFKTKSDATGNDDPDDSGLWNTKAVSFIANFDNERIRIFLDYDVCYDAFGNETNCQNSNGCYELNRGSVYYDPGFYNPDNIAASLLKSRELYIDNIQLKQGCSYNDQCNGLGGTCSAFGPGDAVGMCVDNANRNIGYLSYSHIYVCSDPNPNTPYPPGDPNGKPACLFKPGAKVEDNWAWCSYGGNKDLSNMDNSDKDDFYLNASQNCGPDSYIKFEKAIYLVP